MEHFNTFSAQLKLFRYITECGCAICYSFSLSRSLSHIEDVCSYLQGIWSQHRSSSTKSRDWTDLFANTASQWPEPKTNTCTSTTFHAPFPRRCLWVALRFKWCDVFVLLEIQELAADPDGHRSTNYRIQCRYSSPAPLSIHRTRTVPHSSTPPAARHKAPRRPPLLHTSYSC